MKKLIKKLTYISIVAATLAGAIWKLAPFLDNAWTMLPLEAKLAILVGLTTFVCGVGFRAFRLLRRQFERQPARAVIQGFGTAGDNILRLTKTLFPEKEFNREVSRFIVGASCLPVEEGEVDLRKKTWVEWPGFPCYVMEIAAGYKSIAAAISQRKQEIDDYLALMHLVLGADSPLMNIVVLGNGISGNSCGVAYPWEQSTGASTQMLVVISDREENTQNPVNKRTDGKNTTPEIANKRQTTQISSNGTSEILGQALVKIEGRLVRTETKQYLSLSEEKNIAMEILAQKCFANNILIILSENLPDRGFDNILRKRALLTIALTGIRESHPQMLEEDWISRISGSDIYHISRYPGIYTHSEVRKLSGPNGVVSLVEDLRSGNLVWHLQSFRKDAGYWLQRKILIAFVVGNPKLVSDLTQELRDAVPATVVCVTRNVVNTKVAYALFLAPVFEKEILNSPFAPIVRGMKQEEVPNEAH